MNWVFYSLLVCNGLFFAWQWLERGTKSADVVADIPVTRAVNGLRLLSEVDPHHLRPRARAGVQSVEAMTSPRRGQANKHAFATSSPAPSCYRLGPVANDDEVAQLRAWVLTAGGAPRLRLAERQELALYWVYLPPFSTGAQAVHVAQEMARVGIKDIFVITRGDMAHAVSLGVYAHNASLERRLRQLKAKGYDASVLPRYRVTATSSIDAEFPGSKGFDRERLTARFPDVGAVTISCETMLSDRQGVP